MNEHELLTDRLATLGIQRHGGDDTAALRDLFVDHSGTPRAPVLVVLALLVIGVVLALASLGGYLALAGIAIVELAVVAAPLAWSGGQANGEPPAG
jgi:hypothetical protein